MVRILLPTMTIILFHNFLTTVFPFFYSLKCLLGGRGNLVMTGNHDLPSDVKYLTEVVDKLVAQVHVISNDNNNLRGQLVK